ncbi:hypothetical protein PB01_09915 [Psychrobacillus glaciei]|uniref:Uncharacterized protein n=1 Tax=Psychrobacillus glaciei TaxID=2283160 RepID=A0A5J6SMJ9_9BACI|nr:hypothetical protein PB01_09915 [Psychrobacillus glaciei]
MHNRKKRPFTSCFSSFDKHFFIGIAQCFYALMLIDKKEITILPLFFVPLIIMSINLILWFSKFRIEFYLHCNFAYIGYFCSIFIFYFINYINVDISEWADFPHGEAYWDLFLFVCIHSTLQLVILFPLNFVTYLLYRGAYYFIKRK